MTVQTKTFTVAIDASNNPVPLDLAGVAVGFTTTRWVVVNNLTPYVMELTGVGDNNVDEAALAPGTANKYQWTNQIGPLHARWTNPITGPPPSSPQVIVEYSDDPTGNELSGSYPTTLASGVTIGTITGPVTISGTVAVSSVSGTVNVAGSVSASITNASIPVTGTVNANITNATVNVGGTVNANVTNNVTVTPSGTINVQGVVGGTTIGIAGAVTVSSGTVNIGSVAGTVAITGNVTATISGTPSVTISGTPSVTISSGSVNIGTVTGPVNVQNVVSGALAMQYFTDPALASVRTGSQPFIYTITNAAHCYKTMLVQVLPFNAASYPFCVVVSNGTFSFCVPMVNGPQSSGATSFFQAIVPCMNNVGDTIKVSLWCAAANAPTSVSFTGTTDLEGPAMRPDGRACGVGTYGVSFSGSANGTLIPALGGISGQLRTMLKSLDVAENIGASASSLIATTINNGAAVTLHGGTVSGNASMVWDKGLLLDANTGVSVTVSGTVFVRYGATYDIVV